MYTEIMCRAGQKATKKREDLATFESRQKMVKSEQDTSSLDSSSLQASSTFTGLARSTAYKRRQYDKSNPILVSKTEQAKMFSVKNKLRDTKNYLKNKPGVKIPNDPPLKVSLIKISKILNTSNQLVYINWLSERESHKPINHHNCVMSILHCRH
jgi:hypothetical protein